MKILKFLGLLAGISLVSTFVPYGIWISSAIIFYGLWKVVND